MKTVVNTLNKPEVKHVLRAMGRKTVSTDGGLLLGSLQGNDFKSNLDTRLSVAKKLITESIEDGIKGRRKS